MQGRPSGGIIVFTLPAFAYITFVSFGNSCNNLHLRNYIGHCLLPAVEKSSPNIERNHWRSANKSTKRKFMSRKMFYARHDKHPSESAAWGRCYKYAQLTILQTGSQNCSPWRQKKGEDKVDCLLVDGEGEIYGLEGHEQNIVSVTLPTTSYFRQ